MTADGTTLATVDQVVNSSIWIAPISEPNRAQQLSGGRSDGNLGLSWTPDGHIVYVDAASVGWVMNADGSGVSPLFADRRAARFATQCGVGPALAFISPVGRLNQIFILDTVGGTPRQLTSSEANPTSVTCTPDSKFVLYSDSGGVIRKVAATGDNSTVIVKNAFSPVVSPDGRFFTAQLLDEHNTVKQAILSMADASVVRRLAMEPATAVVWTPDGSGLVAVQTKNRIGNLWKVPADGTAPKQITDFPSQRIFHIALSREGRLAISRGDIVNDVVLIKRQ
jgi:Tol biopolymer transport system component